MQSYWRQALLLLAVGLLLETAGPAAASLAPPPPVALDASSTPDGTLLWWLPPPNPVGAPVTGYTVYRLTDAPSATWTAIGTTSESQTQFLDPSAPLGASVYYVTANSDAGPSSASNPIIAYQGACDYQNCFGHYTSAIRLPGSFVSASCEPLILGLNPNFPYVFHIDWDCLPPWIRP